MKVFATIYEVDPALSSRDDIVNSPILREAADRAYHASKTGPWTILPCSVAYCSISHITSKQERDELIEECRGLGHPPQKQEGKKPWQRLVQTLGDDTSSRNHGHVEYIFDVGNWSPFFKSHPDKKYATMLQMLQYPLSNGSIHIRARESENDEVTIDDKPIIDPKYYQGSGEFDKKIMAMALRFADKICQTEPLSKIIKGPAFPPLPDESNSEDRPSDEEFMEKYTITDWHRKYNKAFPRGHKADRK